MASDKILIKYAMKNDKKEEMFHSSGYAQVQSGSGVGSGAGGIEVAKREAFDQQRKFIKGYNNSKIMQGVKGIQYAKKFTPRTAGGVGSLGSPEAARIGRGDEAVRGGQLAVGGERSATGLRGGTPRGQQQIARGGKRNR